MTLEIEYPNGDRETSDAKIDFFFEEKIAIIEVPWPLNHLRHLEKRVDVFAGKKNTAFVFGAANVERESTNHGVVYRGIIQDAANQVVSFLAY